jgi:hypothetical protein
VKNGPWVAYTIQQHESLDRKSREPSGLTEGFNLHSVGKAGKSSDALGKRWGLPRLARPYLLWL